MPEEYWFEEGCYITEWSNSVSDPACSIARARVQPGQTTAWHWLSETTERYVVLSGAGVAELGTPGERPCRPAQRHNLGPGAVVLIPPGVPQRVTNSGKDDLVFLAICTPRFVPRNYSSENRVPLGP